MIKYERIDVYEGVCSGCHDLSMMVYDLDNVMILNIKDFDYRCFVFNTSRNDAI